jgi:hypothetical protein
MRCDLRRHPLTPTHTAAHHYKRSDAPRLSAKPPSEQPKTYTDGESYRGGHGIWNPNALHVRFRTSRPRTEKGRAGPL